jgi:prepilin-type N-terminal cleavage/methylation domain-containing protein
VQSLLQPLAIKNKQSRSGFTMVELLVAIVLLAAVVLLSQGLLIPLKITTRSNQESSALNYAKSYIELVKVNWLDSTKYGPSVAAVNTDFALATPNYWPSWGTTTGKDIKVPAGWTIAASVTSKTPASSTNAKFAAAGLVTLKDTLRLVTITVTPPNLVSSGVSPVTLTTLIARPSTGVTGP